MIRRLVGRLLERASRDRSAGRPSKRQAVATAWDGHRELLDQYVTTAPSPQNALDVFRAEWSSRLPQPFAALEAGKIPLFEDDRIRWLEGECGGFAGKRILELGPLEAGHTYMLERGGAAEVVAVEANTRAFLKCLIVKELFGLSRSRFLCGDFVEYLRSEGSSFDVCVASGVLYHMREPAELIALLADRCRDWLLLWTHYYDPAVMVTRPDIAHKFPRSTTAETRGFRHSLHRYEYGGSLDWKGFCGGSARYSNWMEREDIPSCLEYFGFGDVRTRVEPNHPNGPAFSLLARRRSTARRE